MDFRLSPCCSGLFLFGALIFAVLLSGAFGYTDSAEVEALKSFRKGIRDPVNLLSNWVGDDPCESQWTGVICVTDDKDSKKQHVHELRLLNMNLTGTLAPDLGNLTWLYILDVMWNNISGSIPPEIGNLSNLYLLLLNGNNLSGTLPDSLGRLSNLNRIQIDQNKISGNVPKTFANLNKAKHFHMNNNSLNGSIPPELGSLQSLVHLLLDNNDLSGPLPPELKNISTLLILQLDNNHFAGEIPSSYSDMYNLTKLSLRNCSLDGTIPDLSSLPYLANLDLSHNNLTGLLPSGKLSDNMTSIDLSYNMLSGPIPAHFSELPNLQNLVLRNNMVNGTVPGGFDNVVFSSSTSILMLDFQNNNISNNNLTDSIMNITLRLYGNPWCQGRANSLYCVSSDVGIDATMASMQNTAPTCSNVQCDPNFNQEVLVLESGECLCTSPLTVGYRLKSPSFAYFPPYEGSFDYYLSSGLNLYEYQVHVSNSSWDSGPRLHMTIKLYPNNESHQFNNSEVDRLYTEFTDWLIPDNNTFGPYEILSFPLLFPYNSTLVTGENSNGLTNGAISGIVVGCVAFTAAMVVAVMFFLLRKQPHYFGIVRKRAGKSLHHERIKVTGVRDFSFEEMALVTNNFSSSMQVGQGGYGKVYRATLADGQEVAIKRAQEGSLQGSKEFYTEIELLSRVHHRNLVSLVGYCDDEGEQMLVYEYIANGSLRDHLSSHEKCPLDFQTRLKIALGSARGILYLHTEANPPIYHRDIKASNILLDEQNKPKVADFGLSRLAPVSDVEGVAPGHVSTVVKGTPGYLDPEYFLTHKLTDKSDVYSFGVVLLELITGMQPISHGKNIVREVNVAYEAGMILSIVDPHMGAYPSEALEPLVRLAIACCKDDTDARPSMAEVVRDLEDIWRNTSWSYSLNSFDNSEVEVGDMKTLKRSAPSNPFISSDGDGSGLMSGTIPNVAPR